jgi:hypothetical protein
MAGFEDEAAVRLKRPARGRQANGQVGVASENNRSGMASPLARCQKSNGDVYDPPSERLTSLS